MLFTTNLHWHYGAESNGLIDIFKFSMCWACAHPLTRARAPVFHTHNIYTYIINMGSHWEGISNENKWRELTETDSDREIEQAEWKSTRINRNVKRVLLHSIWARQIVKIDILINICIHATYELHRWISEIRNTLEWKMHTRKMENVQKTKKMRL